MGYAGKYVGNRPIKLRKSTWRERIDVEALERQKVDFGIVIHNVPRLQCFPCSLLMSGLFAESQNSKRPKGSKKVSAH